MKITMLGDSRVGKTTFMMSTYGLMRKGIQGFRVRCRNKQADAKLNDAYQQFCRTGAYPDQTVKMERYDYDFYCDDDWVMNFTLTDTRGEGIFDYDASQLQDEIRGSDAVMLFLSAYDILNGKNISRAMRRLSMHLNNSFNADDQSKMLMVIFTQCDRVDLDQEKYDILRESVSALESMAAGNDDILYETIPTACAPECMMDLDYAMTKLMLVGNFRDVQARYKSLEAKIDDYNKQCDNFWNIISPSRRRELREQRSKLIDVEIPKFKKMQDRFEQMDNFCDAYELGTSYSVRKKDLIFDF